MDDVQVDLIRRLTAVQEVVGEAYLPKHFGKALRQVACPADVRTAAGNPDSPLWWFIGPVAFALFGREGLQLVDVDRRETVAVLPPPFVGEAPHAMDEVRALGCSVTSRGIVFSRLFAALLYGGYPWYDSYMHACSSRDLFGHDAVVLDIVLPPEVTPASFNQEKERIRALLCPPISVAAPGLPFPGLIRPIHSPEAIEIARHARATRL